MSVKLEAGQWYRTRGGEIRYCIGESKAAILQGDKWIVENDEGRIDTFCPDGRWIQDDTQDSDLIEHLPDCDSFDWNPEKQFNPPKGFRLLETGEKIQNGDYYLDDYQKEIWVPLIFNATSVGMTWRRGKHCPYARKIEPKYRPFKNDVEFAPFRDEWFQDCNRGGFRAKVTAYSDRFVWFAGCSTGESYETAFRTRCREDGSPFGVINES